jgi:hypothetical protein
VAEDVTIADGLTAIATLLLLQFILTKATVVQWELRGYTHMWE